MDILKTKPKPKPQYQRPNIMAPCGHMKPHNPGYPTGNGPCPQCDKEKKK